MDAYRSPIISVREGLSWYFSLITVNILSEGLPMITGGRSATVSTERTKLPVPDIYIGREKLVHNEELIPTSVF